MSYLGQAALKNSELKRFDVTSSTSATHVLSWTAPNEQSLWITINGVKQQDDAYSIAGTPTTVTLTDALVATDKMEVIGIVDIGVITMVGDNSVSTNKLADNSVSTIKIADDAVTTGKILDGTIANSDISTTAAIAVSKLETGTRGDTLFWNSATQASRMAAGTSGYFLKTQGSGADPVWAAAGDAFLATAQNWTAGQRGEITALTSATTVTSNFADSNHFSVTLDHNATFANPTNLTAGQTGSIFITQGSTGGTGSWDTYWDWAAGTAPTLTSTAAAVDRVDYVVRTTTSIQAVATLNLS